MNASSIEKWLGSVSPARATALAAVLVFAFLGAALPPFYLHAFVPEPYFLRSVSQLDDTENPEDYENYFTRKSRPYMIVTALVILVCSGVAFFRSSFALAILLLIAVLTLPAVTFLRLARGF